MADNNHLGELVRRAKGADRSMREYSRDAGVDVAIISKIIKGSYVPKKPEIYRKLTSKAANPRGGITYNDLVQEANNTKSFQDGIILGRGATDIAVFTALATLLGSPELAIGSESRGVSTSDIAVLGAIVMSSISDKLAGVLKNTPGKREGISESDKVLKQYTIKADHFSKLVNGILFEELITHGITFEITKMPDVNTIWTIFDKRLTMKNGSHNEMIIRYAYLDHEHHNTSYFVKNFGMRQIEPLVFMEPTPERMVIIATNCRGTYEFLSQYREKLSYRGDLAILYVDDQNLSKSERQWIARYDGSLKSEDYDWK